MKNLKLKQILKYHRIAYPNLEVQFIGRLTDGRMIIFGNNRGEPSSEVMYMRNPDGSFKEVQIKAHYAGQEHYYDEFGELRVRFFEHQQNFVTDIGSFRFNFRESEGAIRDWFYRLYDPGQHRHYFQNPSGTQSFVELIDPTDSEYEAILKEIASS